MCSISSWLRLCYVLKLVEGLDSYVLLAANVDDFRNIAKKIVPEPLADKLARLASNRPGKHSIRSNNEQSEYDFDSETDEDYDRKKKEDMLDSNFRNPNGEYSAGESVYVKEWDAKISFDELVKRVKDRLTKEINEEFQNKVFRPDKMSQIQINGQNSGLGNGADQTTDILNSNSKFDYINDHDDSKNNKLYSNGQNSNKPYLVPEENNERNINDYSKTDYGRLKKTNLSSKKKEYEQIAHHVKEKQYYNNGRGNTRDNFKNDREMEYPKPDKNYFNDKKYADEEKYSDEKSYDWNSNKYVHNMKDTYEKYYTAKETKNRDVKTKHIQDEDYSQRYEEKLKTKLQERDNVDLKNIDDTHLVQKLSNINKQKKPAHNAELFNQYELTSNRKNDSYEDYILPNKEENIYASEETTKQAYNRDREQIPKLINLNHNKNSRFKVKHNAHIENVKPFADVSKYEYVDVNRRPVDNHEEVREKSQEVKAKTESLWFNEDRLKEAERFSEVATYKYKSKGTVIPTREVYKMVSPNYYISLPTVAERYDPNEPLPERDRQREIIKHFVNPPASINKKVKLI